MRQEMWKRAKDRIWNESISSALRGKYLYDYEFRITEEFNLIFGLSNGGDVIK